ncbi:MAG: OsmC family protein [Bacteroidetes bacterium]|nr:OsmC family protein [Bacteroidota bacterium]
MNKITAKRIEGFKMTFSFNSKQMLMSDITTPDHVSEYPDPSEVLSMALASCMLSSISASSMKYNFPADELSLSIEPIVKDTPHELTGFNIVINMKGEYSEKDKQNIERSARTCLVASTLKTEIDKNITFNFTK